MTFPVLLNPSSRQRSALFIFVSGTRTLFLDGVSQGASTTLTVPAGVSMMRLYAAGGGGGGGGGFATAGGGGGGGGAGVSVRDVPLMVVPGSVLTCTVGGGGAAGAIGGAGGGGASSTIAGVLFSAVPLPLLNSQITPGSTYPTIEIWPGLGGAAGTATQGGSGGGAAYGQVSGGTGGSGAGGAGQFPGIDQYMFLGVSGAAGGAPNFAGGQATLSASGNAVPGVSFSAPAGTASNGGGGNGGVTLFSQINGHGRGGNASTPSVPQNGIWGGGGGGGYGSVTGNSGGDGFILLVWDSPF